MRARRMRDRNYRVLRFRDDVRPGRDECQRYRVRRGWGDGLLQWSVRPLLGRNQLRRRGLVPGSDDRVLHGRGGVYARGHGPERNVLRKQSLLQQRSVRGMHERRGVRAGREPVRRRNGFLRRRELRLHGHRYPGA